MHVHVYTAKSQSMTKLKYYFRNIRQASFLQSSTLLLLFQLRPPGLKWLWQNYTAAMHPGSSQPGEWLCQGLGEGTWIHWTPHTWQGRGIHASG